MRTSSLLATVPVLPLTIHAAMLCLSATITPPKVFHGIVFLAMIAFSSLGRGTSHSCQFFEEFTRKMCFQGKNDATIASGLVVDDVLINRPVAHRNRWTGSKLEHGLSPHSRNCVERNAFLEPGVVHGAIKCCSRGQRKTNTDEDRNFRHRSNDIATKKIQPKQSVRQNLRLVLSI